MPTSVIEHIRSVVGDGVGLRDGELLGRYVDRRDASALAALVNRHGPMVWGVCRRHLSHHDAEDAFQATFIVLVRKASSIARGEAVGNWLYGVAHQTALQARRSAARRRAREVQVTEMPDAEAPQERWADVRPILDEELSRLPDHYRTVIVLSELQGRTRKEVAAQVGCPEGTVASRLVRARAMLAKRLTQRGVALSGGALAVVLSKNGASAGVPASVVMSTIKSASLCGQAAIPVKVAALAEGVLKTMLLTKLKNAVTVLVVVAMVGLIGYGIALGQQQGDPVAPQKQASEKADNAVVKEKAEQKDTTAWGEEVDGLQIGLADVRTIRQGEKAKLAVELRNVGKAEVSVTYRMLRDHAPQITTDTGGRVSVYMPPSFRGYLVPIKRTLKSGETITLYNPEVAVESEDRAKMDGEMRVGTPTICVAPGKYKIAYSGIIESHPKLTTGTVDFEVKDTIAWGKEVEGLQAGLLAEAATCRLGEKLKFTVKLRNVGKAEVSVTYMHPECALQVTTDTGGRVSVYTPHWWNFYGFPIQIKRTVKPGETITLCNPEVVVESEDRAKLLGEMLVPPPTICVAPGKYKIAYSGMIQSHPKVATGTVEFKVKDPVAWGKEAGGLQAGLLISNAADVRIGGKANMVVKLRNVSKETIKVSAWPLWTCYPGVVDARGDRVRTTVAPTPLFEIIPRALTLKPGDTVDVGKSDLLVAEPDQKVTVPDGVVDLCAIHVKPGMHKASCIGFLKDNHTLATGAMEFEVKEAAKPVESFTEWGKESGGLQAGLGYKAGEKRAYTHGETVTLVVRVRNVGKQEVKFRYVRQFFLENPPVVTDGKGKSVPLERVTIYGFHALVPVNLAPGEEIEVGERQLELKPTMYGRGTFSVQYERLETPENDKALSKLASGKLELEVTSDPPEKK